MNNDSKKKSWMSRIGAAIFIVAVISINLLFNSESIRDWADGMKNTHLRKVLYPLSRELHDTVDARHFDRFRSFVRKDLFFFIRDLVFDEKGNVMRSSAVLAVAPPQPPVIADVFNEINPIDILVMGDSLANSIYPAFKQMFKDNKAVRMEIVAWVSSTLSNPVYFDWGNGIQGILYNKKARSGKNYDLIVVLMGANDAQPINIGEWVLSFGTDEWKREFISREKRFAQKLVDSSRRIYWLEVPPMQKSGYRENVVEVNRLNESILKDFDTARWLPVGYLLGDDKGLYTASKVIDGSEEIIRTSDGVHFTFSGSMIIVEDLKNRMFRDFNIQSSVE